jgi:hypothetical protein
MHRLLFQHHFLNLLLCAFKFKVQALEPVCHLLGNIASMSSNRWPLACQNRANRFRDHAFLYHMRLESRVQVKSWIVVVICLSLRKQIGQRVFLDSANVYSGCKLGQTDRLSSVLARFLEAVAVAEGFQVFV